MPITYRVRAWLRCRMGAHYPIHDREEFGTDDAVCCDCGRRLSLNDNGEFVWTRKRG